MRVEARARRGRAWEVKGRPGSFSATSLQSFFCLWFLVVSLQLPSVPLVPLLLPVSRSPGYLVRKSLSPSLLMVSAFVSLWSICLVAGVNMHFSSFLLCGCLCLPVCCFSYMVSVCVCVAYVCSCMCAYKRVCCMWHACRCVLRVCACRCVTCVHNVCLYACVNVCEHELYGYIFVCVLCVCMHGVYEWGVHMYVCMCVCVSVSGSTLKLFLPVYP